MSPTFTEDDVGKSVQTANGEAIGVVAEVDRETAYVDPETEMAGSIASSLEWDRSTEDAVPLADDAVESIDDEAITLAEDFPEESIATAGDEDDRSDDADAEADYAPGDPVAERGSQPAPDDPDLEPEPDQGTGLEDPEPGAGDDLEEDVEDGVLMDAAEEMDGDRERRSAEAIDPIRETGENERAPDDTETRRDLDVDPIELTEEEPEAEIRDEEDVGQRADTRGERERSTAPTSGDRDDGSSEGESESEDQ